MAFDENLTKVSSYTIIEEDDRFHKIHNSLSRLSICTSSDEPTKKKTVLTSESFDGAEADGEVSDDTGRGKENVHEYDSEKERPRFYSLPATPIRRRRKIQVSGERNRDTSRRQRKLKKKKDLTEYGYGFNGGSDGGGTVLTRPKGGEKSMRMGIEEVKACRDLGFELELPGRISVSTGSNLDTQTSSGGNSPIATWRISSPGDDPKEVKARLKVRAQAVALASSSRNT